MQAGFKLKKHSLRLAGIFLQADAAALDIRANAIVDRATGAERMPLSELARIAHFRQDELPKDVSPALVGAHNYTPRQYPFASPTARTAHWSRSIRIQASSLCSGTGWLMIAAPINPLLVEEQIRGGVVQGWAARSTRNVSTTSAASF